MTPTFLPRALVALLLLGLSSAASAQWTLPKNHFGVRLSSSYSSATHEWFGFDGQPKGLRRFPLRGRYERFDLTVDGRWGVTRRFELGVRVTTALASYRADPVILQGAPLSIVGADDRLDYYQDNIIDVSGREAGLGDVYLSGTFNLVRRQFAASIRLAVKLPGGYRQPEGTFRGGVTSAEELMARADELITPENAFGTVTLGLGQVDLIASLPLGYAARSRTFIVFEPSYALRLGGAGDQVRARLTLGQSIGHAFTLVASAYGEFTVVEGDVYGVSLGANPPRTEAALFDENQPIFFREVRLQQDAVRASGAAVLRLGSAEITFRYERTVWGRNTVQEQSFSIGIGTLFDGGTIFGPPSTPEPEPEPEPELEPEPESEYDEPVEVEPVEEHAEPQEESQTADEPVAADAEP
ncbi:MAG: hypothetical protein AAGE52_23795 [Myxococcota bacterium]